MNELILVDVLNIAYRSHYAFPTLSYEGKATGALYGFLKAVLELRQISKRLCFCWDHGMPGDPPKIYWRRELFSGYKSNRQKAPKPNGTLEQFEQLFTKLGGTIVDATPAAPEVNESSDVQQVMALCPLIRNLISLMGHPSIGVPGYEADDCIGWLSRIEKGPVLIHSSDEDLYQLLTQDGRVQILKPGKVNKEFLRINAAMVEAAYEVPVDLWADYLALGADTSDCYTVKGMGPGTAKKLVMLGTDPTLAFADQHPEVQTKAVKWEPFWEQVQTAAILAKIPDPQHAGLNEDAFCEVSEPIWPSTQEKEKAFKQFTTFCADYGMAEFWKRSKEFFN